MMRIAHLEGFNKRYRDALRQVLQEERNKTKDPELPKHLSLKGILSPRQFKSVCKTLGLAG